MLIVVGEGTFRAPHEFMDVEHNAFDRRMSDQAMEISGLDLMELGGDVGEHLGDWRP